MHYKSKSLKVDILEEVLHLAEEKGIKVDLILPVPEYEDSIPKLLYLNQFKSINKQKYLSENTEYFAQINVLKNQYQIFTAYDVHNVLCQSDCAIKSSDNKPYYFDSHHLTLTGAQQLKPVFERIFLIR